MDIIDLRSDTVTKPTPKMIQAMMNAKVGDDVYEEDPTVKALEKLGAELFGKEAAIFCPSGTMSNQIAIKIQTQALTEVICEKNAHIYQYETGGIAYNSSASVRCIEGHRGQFTIDEVIENINPDNIHHPITALVSIENTSNKGGGACWNIDEIKKIHRACRQNNLKLHLDGARIFNALVAKNNSPKEFGELFDTISICLSKGLGAPIGSLLIGNKLDIKNAKRVRKVLGGGMRQAGILAAAGIYALENNIERLSEDHLKAKTLENNLKNCNFVDEIIPVETNIVLFKLNQNWTTTDFLETLKKNNILASAFGKQSIRLVTHLDIDDEKIENVSKVLQRI